MPALGHLMGMVCPDKMNLKLAKQHWRFGSLVSPAVAEKISGFNRNSVRRKIENGKILSVRIDGKVFVVLPSLICEMFEKEIDNGVDDMCDWLYSEAKNSMAWWKNIQVSENGLVTKKEKPGK